MFFFTFFIMPISVKKSLTIKKALPNISALFNDNKIEEIFLIFLLDRYTYTLILDNF